MVAGPETIAAIATPAGRGGIGVVRISGPLSGDIGHAVAGNLGPPREAVLRRFRDARGRLLDEGLAIFFPAPNSYTGEDVLELQGHGGPVVLREILRACLDRGARLAEPGEFTRRAFLNERLDLAQAEGVADLIDAASAEAVRGAARSLAGEFSARIAELVEAVTALRMHVEACIDFPEEEIDPADRAQQQRSLADIREQLAAILAEAAQGVVLRDGLTVVLVGTPNVGKSSLLNRLAGDDVAIVTPIPGTTRDHVRATILLEGVPIHLVDTAGLRESEDEVERIGMARTWDAIATAGAAVLIADATREETEEVAPILARMEPGVPVARVTNKIDLVPLAPSCDRDGGNARILLSAKTGEGMTALRRWLLDVAGWRPGEEGAFLARERHLEALRDAAGRLETAAEKHAQAFELFAEDMRLAQEALGRITGAVTADDLLGHIFSRFCIGK